jgi:hypothetical protein
MFIGAPYTKMLNENLARCCATCAASAGAGGTPSSARSPNTGSTVKMHVRQHIEDFVLTYLDRARRRVDVRGQRSWPQRADVLPQGSCSSIRETASSRI